MPSSGIQYFGVNELGVRVWVPLVTFAVLGFVLVALGLLANRRPAAPTAVPPAV